MTAAVIFDLDGTLLNTLDSLAAAFNQALDDMGCTPHTVDAYRTIIGDGARVAAMRALPPTRQAEEDIDRCVTLFQGHYAETWQTAGLYPGVSDLVSSLSGSIPIAVLSNKDQAFTQQCCDYFFPGSFDIALGFSAGIRHKPDPSGAAHIAGKLQIALEDIWMIGDTATDMKTAMATGMTGVGVLWGFRDRAELDKNGATHIIESPSELISLLDLQE